MKLKPMNVASFIIFLPLFFTITIITPPQIINSVIHNSTNEETTDIPPLEYFHVTLPLPTDGVTPSCSVGVVNHTVAENITVDYTPPPATCAWSVAVLDFRAECKGYDRKGPYGVAGVWIAGVELLRTSTAPPSGEGTGSFWKVRKDVTKYSSVFAQKNLTVTVAFENVMTNDFSNEYSVNVSLLFYSYFDSSRFEANSLSRKLISDKRYEIGDNLSPNRVIKPSYPYDTPADLIIPVSGAIDEGFWFKIHNESDVKTKNVRISDKTYKAVLELYVSFHGDDEFWYMNPPDSYITANNLPVTNAKGAYREVLVTIDGKLVGSVIPFPVIFPDGINPLFWKPVVSIGAFDLPSSEIDLTSYLGFFQDNEKHSIGFQVADGLPFWLVDANLHVWMDDRNVRTIVEYEPPSVEIEQDYDFKGLNGEFETEVKRKTSTIRLVQSSKGVMETKVTEEIRFKNKLKFKHFGAFGSRKELEQTIKRKTKIKVMNRGYTVGETVIEKRYPLKITVESGGSRVNTTVIQRRREKFVDEISSISRVLNHEMNCTGWMAVKGDYGVVSGYTENQQSYSYKDGESGCYLRNVDVVGGDVVTDETTSICVD